MPLWFGKDEDLTFGIDWKGDNNGTCSWGSGSGDDSSTCLYGLWQNVSPPNRPAAWVVCHNLLVGGGHLLVFRDICRDPRYGEFA